MGFTACDDYKEGNPPGQENPQGSVLDPASVSVETDLASGEIYDLAKYDVDNNTIDIATIACTELPAGYDFIANVEISEDDFANVTVVKSSVVPAGTGLYQVQVTADDLQSAINENITKNPVAIDFQFRMNVMTLLGEANSGQIAYVGGADNYYGPWEATVQPFAANIIEDAYYLVTSANNFDVASAVKFGHSDVNVYDDPVFQLSATIPDGGAEWLIIPATSYNNGTLDGAIGVEKMGANSGYLVALDDNGQKGLVSGGGSWLFTVNMESHTYSTLIVVDYLSVPTYTVKAEDALKLRALGDDVTFFTGTVHLNNNFYFTGAPEQPTVNLVGNGEPVVSEDGYDETGALSLLSTVAVADQFKGAKSGLYYLEVSLSTMEYRKYYIESLCLIGNFTDPGWDFNAAVQMTPTSTAAKDGYLQWKATGVQMKAGNEYKIAANNAWTISYGGQLTDIVQNGGNITVTEDGTYDFLLDFSVYPNTLTVTKQ